MSHRENVLVEGYIYRERDRQTDRQTVRDRQTEKDRDRERQRQRETEKTRESQVGARGPQKITAFLVRTFLAHTNVT